VRLEKIAGGRSVYQIPELRGLDFAWVDEADSVLIDEAVTPTRIKGQRIRDEGNRDRGSARAVARRCAVRGQPYDGARAGLDHRSDQIGKFLSGQQKSDRASLAGNTFDQPTLFEGHDHSVRRGGRDLEVVCHVVLGGRTPVELGVIVNEREELSLPRRIHWLFVEPTAHPSPAFIRRCICVVTTTEGVYAG